jgi:dephospho-CoA kinase
MAPKLVIGLIGAIGGGKSAAAAALARRGGLVLGGDEIAHLALRDPEVRRRVVERWGPGVLGDDGEVQRRKLGAIVFADRKELKALEALVHPWVKGRIREEIARAQADPSAAFVVLDAAVMLEAGWHDVCDRLVFVDAPREQRVRRVAGRGWSEEELARREAAQLPLTEKAARADHVLDNSRSLEHLERQVDDLLRRWLRPADREP